MVLAGGYFGGWLPWESCAGLRADPQQLQAAGAGLGAGVLIVAPAGSCIIAETARITAYLARESAGQCGPCVNGVAAVARDLARMCTVDAGRVVTERLRSRIDIIDGRGGCALPDGVRRLVASVLEGFPDHVAMHERHGACSNAPQLPMSLPSTPLGPADWR
jgi:NADH:ubiquinone oxidoreductase subunit F (NADH-binding)